MLRFIGLYFGLIVVSRLFGEGQGTFFPHVGLTNGGLGLPVHLKPVPFNFAGDSNLGFNGGAERRVTNGGGAQTQVQGEDLNMIKAQPADAEKAQPANVGLDTAQSPEAQPADVGEVAISPAGGVEQGGAGELIESTTLGTWELFVNDSGVSAMHIQILPTNKAVFYDATSLGPSNLRLPADNCRLNIPSPNGPVTDCYSHAVMMDTFSGQIRPLKVMSDVWCSSGALDVNGVLVSTGGWFDGERGLRYIGGCDTCDFRENVEKLADVRWYGTQVQLASGEFVEFGGRHAFTYEFVPPEGTPSTGRKDLPFLLATTDRYENNLYPFVHLAPDNNVFIFANFKSILFDPVKSVVVREYPDLPGGARNYPGSACATTLPIKLARGQKDANDIELIICGGGQPEGFGKAEKNSVFTPALDTCARIKFMQPDAAWDIETMPSQRVMGDMLNLPNGQIVILNGAQRGVSGWTYAESPNLTPVLYSPDKPKGERFKQLEPTTIARMYHSVAALLVTGNVLVAGSNSNQNYIYTAKFPTELRIEKFNPPNLDKALDPFRPRFKLDQLPTKVTYGESIVVSFVLNQADVKPVDMTLSLYKPPFTTHGYSMNQRLIELGVICANPVADQAGEWSLAAEAPQGGHLAPPGYYMMFISYRGVTGVGSWIQLLPDVLPAAPAPAPAPAL